jgi:hypothetical protein
MNIYERIVESIMQEFHGRSGIGPMLESIKAEDIETYWEIKADLVNLIKQHIHELCEMELHS